MQVKELIAKIFDDLIRLPAENPKTDILVRIESQQSLKKLKIFLHKYSQCEDEMTFKALKPFCDLLSDRWLKIKHTDSCYVHEPDTPANVACLILAKHLSEILNEQVYNLLMPSVAAIVHHMRLGNFNHYALGEFVLGDDGTPIDVAQCLDEAAANKTTILFHNGMSNKPLSSTEKDRVIHHSIEAYDYYDSIQFYVETNIKNDLIVAYTLFHTAMKEKNYTLTCTYGKEGKKRLMKSILSGLNDWQDFIEIMTHFIPLSEWKTFLNKIETNDLIKYILRGDPLPYLLQKQYIYSGDSIHDKAVLYCFTEICKRSYAGEKNFLDYFLSYSNHANIAAAEFLQDFFVSSMRLNQLEQFLNETNQNHHRGPLFWKLGELSMICEQAGLVSSPLYFQRRKPGFWDKFA